MSPERRRRERGSERVMRVRMESSLGMERGFEGCARGGAVGAGYPFMPAPLRKPRSGDCSS